MNTTLTHPSLFTRKNIPVIRQSKDFLPLFIRWSWIVLLSCSFLQLTLFWSQSNLFAVFIVNVCWFIFQKSILKLNVFRNHPFSCFLILGFIMTQLYLPLVFTLIEFKPVIYNLLLPYDVFIHSFLALIILVLGHIIYRSMAQSNLRVTRKYLLRNTLLYKPPSDMQLWLMGLMGLFAMFYIYFYSPSVERSADGIVDKILQACVGFTYAPFFIPFSKLWTGKEVNKKVIGKLLLFTLLLFIVSIGRNSRGGFMMGFTALGFSYALGVLIGIIKFKIFSMRNVFFAGVLIYLLTGPLADLSTAMILVRTYRDKVDRVELIKLTLDKFQDKEAIEKQKEADQEVGKDWDEAYVNNSFLSRFSNIKFNDASLVEAEKMKSGDMSMFYFFIDYTLSFFPTPILKLFNININKEQLNSMSIGDYLYYRGGASNTTMGTFRTGHFAGTGMAALGWFYLIILLIIMMPVYFLLDILSFSAAVDNKNTVRLSMCGLIVITSVFTFMNFESVINPIQYLIRGWVQGVLIYITFFYITLKASVIFSIKKEHNK